MRRQRPSSECGEEYVITHARLKLDDLFADNDVGLSSLTVCVCVAASLMLPWECILSGL